MCIETLGKWSLFPGYSGNKHIDTMFNCSAQNKKGMSRIVCELFSTPLFWAQRINNGDQEKRKKIWEQTDILYNFLQMLHDLSWISQFWVVFWGFGSFKLENLA